MPHLSTVPFPFGHGSSRLRCVSDQESELDGPLLSQMEVAAAIALALAITIACLFLISPLAAISTGALAALMALITLSDFKHFIIPNEFSLPAIPLGVAANVMVFNADDWMAGLTESLLGVVLAAGSFYLLRAVWYRWRGVDGLGMGDVKLAGVAGAWLGPALLASACLAAALAGLVTVVVMMLIPGRRVRLSDHIPFGCFIAPVILLFWMLRVFAGVPFW